MKVLLLLVVLALFLSPAFATEPKPKPKPVPGTPTQQSVPTPTPVPDEDRKEANAYGGAAVSALATYYLKDEKYGALWAVAGTSATAALVELGQPGSYDARNVWYAVGGAAIGTIGTCAVIARKNFIGCKMEFK